MENAGGGRRTCATLPTFRTRTMESLGGGAVPSLQGSRSVPASWLALLARGSPVCAHVPGWCLVKWGRDGARALG